MNQSAPHMEQFVETTNGPTLCYRQVGDSSAPAILLIAGLGLQLIYWPQRLLDELMAKGFQVIWFDNRDVGRSTSMDSATPGAMDLLFRRKLEGAYDLTDMANDAIGLLDHLSIEKAHIAGMSMGGMIGQMCAALHPHRVLTLTSIFSTTGARRVGQPSLTTLWHLLQPSAKTQPHAVKKYTQLALHLSDKGYPVDPATAAKYAALAWQRGRQQRESQGAARQMAAIIKSGNRTRYLANIQAPTLVLHGDRDVIVHPSGGIATANAITHAQHRTIEGLGHYITEEVSPLLANYLHQHASQQG